MPARRGDLVTVIALLLCATVLAYVELPLNAKSDFVLQAQPDGHKRHSISQLGGGRSIGYYYIDLTFGSQQFRVDIDTGSSTFYLVGPYCHFIENGEACTYARNYYQGNGTYQSCIVGCDDCQNKVCLMHSTYGDRTKVFGAVTKDTLKIGNYTATAPIAISYLQSERYTQSNSGTFMDGLWGMGYSSLNGGQPTAMDALVSSGMPNVFTICMSDNGGYLVMGGINTALHTGVVSYTPVTSESYYVLSVASIAVGSTTLSFSMPSTTILDSGTTLTYIPEGLYNELANTLTDAGIDSRFFSARPRNLSEMCHSMPNNAPIITFTLPSVGGGTFDLRFDKFQYMYPCSSSRLSWAFGFFVGSNDLAILGANFMRPWNNVFDRANKQIGFAPVSSSCTGSLPTTSGSKTIPAKSSPFSAASSFKSTPELPSFTLFAAFILAMAL